VPSALAAPSEILTQFLGKRSLLPSEMVNVPVSLSKKTVDMQPYSCISYLNMMKATFKALADETRRKLLDELYVNNGQTLTQLCGLFDMSRQAVTKHLYLLESANLVTTVWDGREKLHYLNPVPIHEIAERWIGKYDRQRLQALSDLKKSLDKNKKGLTA